MSNPITATSMLKCTMGLAPMPIKPTPNKIMLNLPSINLADSKPMMNITPFNLCRNPANPLVAKTIAVSLGSVTVDACVPLPTPWITTTPKILLNNIPSVNAEAKKMCYPGGIIDVIKIPMKIMML